MLRGVSTIVVKDAKATARITGMSDMHTLIVLMDHPVVLIQVPINNMRWGEEQQTMP